MVLNIRMQAVLATVLLVSGCCCQPDPCCGSGASAARAMDGGADEAVAIADLPDAVRAAAARAVPGIVLEEAEREFENGRWIYSVEGEAGGTEWDLEITPAGKVLEVEQDDDDDDDEDDDDDGDDDGDHDDA